MSFLLVNCANTHHYKHRSSRFFSHTNTPDLLPSHVKNHPDCLHTGRPRWAESGKRSTFLYVGDCFLAGDTLERARVNEARLSKRGDSSGSEAAALYLGRAEGTGTSGVPAANRRALEENSRINALIRST